MRDIDVICAGLALVNFPLHPVDERIFHNDVNPVDPITLLPGGDAANQAIVLSRLGAKVSLASVVGRDLFGESLLRLLKDRGEGIDLSHIETEPGESTGVCAMLIQPDGRRNFCMNRGCLLKLGLRHMHFSLLRRARVVSIGGLMSLPGFDGDGTATYFRMAREAGAITVADTKKDLWGLGLSGVRKTLQYTDYFFPSLEEAAAVTKESQVEKMAEVFLDAGAGHVGIKLGKDGCYFLDQEQEFYLPAYACQTVDTTGAGDNFMAGFIMGILQGWDIRRTCRFACAAGAICASVMGPNDGIKNMAQVLEFMKKQEDSYESCGNYGRKHEIS